MNARLAMERAAVDRTLARGTRATLARVSPDGRLYEIVFDVRTLVRGPDRIVREEARAVPVFYDLAAAHPIDGPVVIAAHADLFNPNVASPADRSSLPPIPWVCLGTFRPYMRIADLIVATYRLLAWQRYALDHPLSPSAAAWARSDAALGRLPVDRRPFFDDEGAPPSGTLGAAPDRPAATLRVRRRS
jgi:hypothetical protein